MRLIINGDCPKCLTLVEAEYQVRSTNGKCGEIDLEDIVKGKFICSRCNSEGDMKDLLRRAIYK